jgi:hypothetical protein
MKSGVPFLKPPQGASAYVELPKPGFVGRVLKLVNPGGGREIHSFLCLPPGLTTPSKREK